MRVADRGPVRVVVLLLLPTVYGSDQALVSVGTPLQPTSMMLQSILPILVSLGVVCRCLALPGVIVSRLGVLFRLVWSVVVVLG